MKQNNDILTYKQINDMTDVPALEALVEKLDFEVNHIQAQLDHLVDEDSVEWEQAAITALAYKRQQFGCAFRRLKHLTKKSKSNAHEEQLLADAIRREAKSREALAAAENRKIDEAKHALKTQEKLEREKLNTQIRIEETKTKTANQVVQSARRMLSDAMWRTCAYDILDEETRQKIDALMFERYADKLEAFAKELIPKEPET